MSLLAVENLRTYFYTEDGIVQAVDGVDFEVQPGETIGLVGESGAGKSVTVESIIGLITPPGKVVEGTIRFDGRDLRELTDQELRRTIRGTEISVVFQDPMSALNPVFTIGSQITEIIEYHQDITEEAAKERAIELLGDVGIPDPAQRAEQYPHEFSGGMRQRVLIAMALSCNPKLIIADEPTTALDVTIQAQILDLFNEIQEEYDTSIIYVTHDLGVAREVCDRIAVMYLGKIVETARYEELYRNPKHPYTQLLMRSVVTPERVIEHSIRSRAQCRAGLIPHRVVDSGRGARQRSMSVAGSIQPYTMFARITQTTTSRVFATTSGTEKTNHSFISELIMEVSNERIDHPIGCL